jgi:phosphoribosyl 1,2-cyclic phosphate phosphodiesterase
MKSTLHIDFLGTGTSQGVPVIGCECEVCTSSNPKDQRLRTSIAIKKGNTQIVIDSGPDFRQQILRAKIKKLDALVFTHEHKDHISGMDDIRAFNYIQQEPIQLYCTQQVHKALEREYHYVFDEKYSYPGIPQVETNLITKETSFQIGEMQLIPIEVMHLKLPVLGFRIDDFVYITDANYISDEEKLKLQGTKVLVIDALRKEKHVSHFNLDEAIALIKEVNPDKAYIIHISHHMGLHDEVSAELPENVFLAYDGLSLEM